VRACVRAGGRASECALHSYMSACACACVRASERASARFCTCARATMANHPSPLRHVHALIPWGGLGSLGGGGTGFSQQTLCTTGTLSATVRRWRLLGRDRATLYRKAYEDAAVEDAMSGKVCSLQAQFRTALVLGVLPLMYQSRARAGSEHGWRPRSVGSRAPF